MQDQQPVCRQDEPYDVCTNVVPDKVSNAGRQHNVLGSPATGHVPSRCGSVHNTWKLAWCTLRQGVVLLQPPLTVRGSANPRPGKVPCTQCIVTESSLGLFLRKTPSSHDDGHIHPSFMLGPHHRQARALSRPASCKAALGENHVQPWRLCPHRQKYPTRTERSTIADLPQRGTVFLTQHTHLGATVRSHYGRLRRCQH